MTNGNNREKKLRLALIGKDVSESESESMHRFILRSFGADCDYENVSVSPERFDAEAARLAEEKDGFNVTIPYKADATRYVSEQDPESAAFGAVNTIVTHAKSRGGDGRAKGYNTDGTGFMLMLKDAGVETRGKKVVVLGAGGAGRSTAATLRRAGAEVFVYRRNRELLEKACAALGVSPVADPESEFCDILINCTGVGMHGSVGVSPVSERGIEKCRVAIDLIYRPARSEFLRLAQRAGKKILNGHAMLFYQAYYADCLYLDLAADEARAKTLYQDYLSEKGE